MATSTVTGDDISEAETPAFNDVVRGSVDFNGLPSSRSKSGCWKSAFFIIGINVAVRFGHNGVSSNLISYLAGPLRQSTAVAAANVNAWSGTAMLMPIMGALVADSYLGRFRTIIIASLLYSMGLGFLSLSAALNSHSSECKNHENNLACSPSLLEVIAFFFSLYLVALGEGGLGACLQAFGADQFDEQDKNECEAKSSFFNWSYFSTNGGVLVARLVLSYIQENLSWALGFGIPCIAMCFTLITFLLGSKTYRFHINSDKRNPIVRISRAFVKAARNRQGGPTVTSIQEKAQQVVPYDGARSEFPDETILATDGSAEHGNLCNMHDIDDAKAILRLLPIWSTCLGYPIVISQAFTLFTKQGSTMYRHITHGFQIPAASLLSLMNLSVLIFIPIYDRILVPAARAITKKPAGISMLQRIGTGIFLTFLCMVIAALVESRRLATAIKHGLVDKPKETLPMSVWWLAPQYVLFGISNVFVVVGLQEFFYDQIPSELKSIGQALFLSIFGIGNFLSSFLISIIEKATRRDGHDSWFSNNLNQAHINYFYWLLAGLSAVTTAAYAYFAKSYVYKRRGTVSDH